VPKAFPSHKRLLAPLWRRWPGLFDVPALCVGAAMPDVIDGVIGAFRGHLGQTLGHSFLGLFVFCIPVGLALWVTWHAVANRLPPLPGSGFAARAWNGARATTLAATPPSGLGDDWGLVLCSLGIGAISHMFFDLISHGGFPWLLPWVGKVRIFPDWWYTRWAELPLPGYHKPHAVGPHLMVWFFLSALGAYLLFRPAFRRRS